jgi:hypothetical protein
MTQSEIIRTQKRIGATPDGFWGPKSIEACKQHLRQMMPSPHPFPAAGTSAFDSFYGRHGEPNGYTPPMKKIQLPFTIFYGDSQVRSLSAHTKCADSLLRVFQRLAQVYPDTASRRAAGILTYDGLYNPRKMRGGSSWSMHAWAIAIDLNARQNGNHTHWPVRATMPIEVMECFAKEGWLAAGCFWSRDAMHFQATRP